MRTILCSQGIWSLITVGYSEPADYIAEQLLTVDEKAELEENCKKDAKAFAYIQQGVPPAIFAKISTANNAKEAWELLETSYQGAAKVKTIKLQNWRREFENLKIKESDSVEQFTTQVTNLVTQLRLLGEELLDQRIVEKVLRSMPKKFESVVVIIEESKDLS